MARPKPRSLGPSGQDNVPPGEQGKLPAPSNAKRQGRQGSDAQGSPGKEKDADVRLAKRSKADKANSDASPGAKDRASGFSPMVNRTGQTKGSPFQPGPPSGGNGSSKQGSKPMARGAQRVRGGNDAGSKGSQVIPETVAQRMLRRIAIATGVPSALGMAVFVGSYLLVSRQILDVPPVATLLASGTCFLLGVVGLSYGVLSASWEEAPGTLLGTEQLAVNISRVRSSLRAMRQGGAAPPPS
jgi:hypothetical protein